jgi:hypothetical protein
LFAADQDLGGIVAAVADVGDWYPESFWHWIAFMGYKLRRLGEKIAGVFTGAACCLYLKTYHSLNFCGLPGLIRYLNTSADGHDTKTKKHEND